MSRVLIIEDERDIVTGLRDAFEHHGFEVRSAHDGDQGLRLALTGEADVIILDLMLPKRDGIEVCRELRERNVQTPIIMVTARGEEADRVTGLEIGADDYMTKPFSTRELIARIDAILRRTTREDTQLEQVRIGDATVDFTKYVIIHGSERHSLTDREMHVLRFFLDHPHEVISRNRLLTEVWGYDAYPSTRTIDTFVYRLRQMIERDAERPEHLLTVRGVGYKLVP
ncbi:MAG: response regulator transcription factor [Gammaproteobacteria bacterium]|nr:response regulator transcription factor [Gammaproteobacteria bacterium]